MVQASATANGAVNSRKMRCGRAKKEILREERQGGSGRGQDHQRHLRRVSSSDQRNQQTETGERTIKSASGIGR